MVNIFLEFLQCFVIDQRDVIGKFLERPVKATIQSRLPVFTLKCLSWCFAEHQMNGNNIDINDRADYFFTFCYYVPFILLPGR
jgi:hypothetical protein